MNAYHELAEAIRAGAAIRPQATNGDCFERRPLIEPGQCASCALGAAYESVVGPVQTWQEVPDWYEVAEEVYEAFPCISEPAPPCPEPTCQGAKVKSFHMSWDARDYVQNLINHLNDEHGWSREAIASWLDTL
jgi:hypothetical protein